MVRLGNRTYRVWGKIRITELNSETSFMVNQTNKQTFDFPLVGEVCNLAGVECPINSKVYHSL